MGAREMADKIRVLLADANEGYCALMKSVIESTGEFELVAHTGHGAEALSLARQLRPDVVVTDAVLSGMDGFDLLRRLEGTVPGRVMATGFCSQSVLLQAIREEVRLFLPKPFTDELMLETLRRACGAGVERRASARLEATVSEALRDIGMPAHIKGYPYTRRAILMVMEDPSLAHALTKALYPALARQFATTPTCVERSIRSAIDQMWLRGDVETQRAFFGAALDMDNGKPTNGRFIAAVAEKLRLQLSGSAA